MADRLVKGPDGTIHRFPADATDAEISAELEAQPERRQLEARGKTWTDTALDWLPTAAGAVGGIAGAVGGPLGAMGGAALGGAAGEAIRQRMNVARGVQPEPTLRQAATDVGTQAVMQGGAELAGGALGAVARPLARRVGGAVMQAAIKPGIKDTTKAFLKGVSAEHIPVVRTLLNEGVNVTPGGIAKLDRIIQASNDEVAQAVASIPGDINPFKVTKRLTDTTQRFGKQVNPASDLEAISRAGQEFLEEHGGQALTPASAQALKSGTYRELKGKAYGELKGAQIEAQKSLARGLKEEIEAEYAKSLQGIKQGLGMGGTDIAAVNAREGAAITAKEAIARRLAAAGNRDPVALAWLAHNPVTGLAFLLERSPAVKSLIARGAYNAAGSVAKVSPQVVRLLVTSVAASPDDAEPVR